MAIDADAGGVHEDATVHLADVDGPAARVANVLQKKNGSRTFIVKVTDITNQHDVRVAEMRSTIVVRGG